MNQDENLSDSYKKSTSYGKIQLTSEGLKVRGDLIENVDLDSIKVKKFSDKTIITCCLICDEFESIPKNST